LGFNRPAYFNWDFSAIRRFSIIEGVSLDFRAEFFNFPNHANFLMSSNYKLDDPNLAKVTETVGNLQGMDSDAVMCLRGSLGLIS
jgi:hypothetical protein